MTARLPSRILAIAYACEPARGSEPGAGWAWARMLSRIGETWVITRRDYQDAIERALPEFPECGRLKFVYVEVPERFRGWQQGLRGLRLYYLLWQIAALQEAKRLQRAAPFDAVWHLTWANAWYGSLAALAGRPFVYGPVGGCVGTVWRLLPRLGVRGAWYEIARMLIHGTSRYVNPLARLSWRRADMILAQNTETRDWFPRRHREKVTLFPNAVVHEEVLIRANRLGDSRTRTMLYAGRLEPFKGVFLCIYALARLPNWRLSICGSGNDESRLRRLAGRLGVSDRVDWLGWLPRDELLARMAEAEVFMFPSLHEEAGAVVAEARAAGLPIICLDRGGPPLLAGPLGVRVSDSGGALAIAQRLADAAVAATQDPRMADRDDPHALSLERRTEALRDVLANESFAWLGASNQLPRTNWVFHRRHRRILGARRRRNDARETTRKESTQHSLNDRRSSIEGKCSQ